jgi:hypothetical protein
MSYPNCAQLLADLENNWGRYVEAWRALPPEVQSAWLAAQGYARFADVLAHVVAWWQEGYAAVDAAAASGATGAGVTAPFASQEYDVDACNAAAVARFAPADEETVIAVFEAQRTRWTALLARLPDAALADARIVARLEMELVNHWTEHALTPP